MTITTLGRMDAFCTQCRREVLVDDALVCPECGGDVDRRSLPVAQKSAATMGRPVASAPAEMGGAPRRHLSLPPTREALAWDKATDTLLAALEAEEEAARLAYEAAKERARAARQAAADMRTLRGLVRVDRAQPALAAPRPPRRKRVETTTVAAEAGATGERWHSYYRACRDCGTRDPDRPHARWGRCAPCLGTYRAQKRSRDATRGERR
jgi:hypothetical protein